MSAVDYYPKSYPLYLSVVFGVQPSLYLTLSGLTALQLRKVIIAENRYIDRNLNVK